MKMAGARICLPGLAWRLSEQMKAVGFFTNKGGVGKTTLLCNLAGFLSLEKGKKIAVIDADPQANATQYMFPEDDLEEIYDLSTEETVFDFARPLSQGKGYSSKVHLKRSKTFGVDVVLGDPRLALLEDFLAADWSTSGVRSIRSTYVFRELLQHLSGYDYVFIDMGPSLGSINRAALISSDYFVIPVSIDIFSVRAIGNISEWLSKWRRVLEQKLTFVDEPEDLDIHDLELRLKLLGHVNQQYTAKRDAKGKRRAVRAYEKIMKGIPAAISKNIVAPSQPDPEDIDYSLGEIPNLHSLIPMSQTSRKPVFALKSADGVVGAHFTKVGDAYEIFRLIASRFEENIEILS